MDNNTMLLIGGIVVIIIVIAITWKKKGKDNFNIIPASKTIQTDIKKMVTDTGVQCNGQLNIGYTKIKNIDKYLLHKGQFSTMIYDPKTRAVVSTEKGKQFEVIILRKANDFFLVRWIGSLFNWFKTYYVINNESILYQDPKNNIWVIRDSCYMLPYCGVYVNSDISIEYVDDISLKYSKESILTHLQNFADKAVYIELQTAKLNNKIKVVANAEASKWEGAKTHDDTKVL